MFVKGKGWARRLEEATHCSSVVLDRLIGKEAIADRRPARPAANQKSKLLGMDVVLIAYIAFWVHFENGYWF